MQKSDLLKWLQDAFQDWEQLIHQVEPQRLEELSLPGGWSVKDLVAHLTGWNRRLASRIQAAQRGEPEPPPPWPAHLEETDDINAWIYESNHDRPVAEVLDDARYVFQRLVAAVEGLPDDARVEAIHHEGRDYHFVWANGQRHPVSEFFDHFYDDHAPDLRAWLTRHSESSSL